MLSDDVLWKHRKRNEATADSILNLPMLVCVRQYVDWNDLATMLAANRAADVTPDVNLKNPLHTGNKACKQGNPT